MRARSAGTDDEATLASPGALKRAKLAVLRLARGSGVYRLVGGSRWRRSRLLILCYHGVSLEDEHAWHPSLYMAPEVFAERLRLLRDGGWSVLPLGEALERLYAGRLPERSVAITFDDGFHDFYAVAYPALRALGMPATLYLTSHYCEHNVPVFPLVCSYLLWKRRGARVPSDGLLEDRDAMDLRTEAGRAEALERIQEETLPLSTAEKDEWLDGLAGVLRVDLARLRARRLLHLVTPEEASELARGGVDIQLHTHRHRSPPDPGLYAREIRENAERIRRITDAEPRHFCYPSGWVTPEIRSWVEGEKVASATTLRVGLASPASDRLMLPRLADHGGLAPLEFEAWLTGVAAALPGRRTRPVLDRFERGP